MSDTAVKTCEGKVKARVYRTETNVILDVMCECGHRAVRGREAVEPVFKKGTDLWLALSEDDLACRGGDLV